MDRLGTPFHDDGGQRLGQALQRQMPSRGEPEPASRPDQDPDKITGQDLPRVRPVAEPLCHHHGPAEVVAVVGDGLAGMESDPDPNRRRRIRPVGVGHGQLHGDGTTQGFPGAGERSHEPVAQVLHLRAAGVIQCPPKEREVTTPNLLGHVVAESVE